MNYYLIKILRRQKIKIYLDHMKEKKEKVKQKEINKRIWKK